MRSIDVEKLSGAYVVRRMDGRDVPAIYDLCLSNPQYYRYCGRQLSVEQIERDLAIVPPNTAREQKYYVGFFDGEALVAVMDLIDGYPSADCAFIGFFMVDGRRQGHGVGSGIICDVTAHLRSIGMTRCRLGIDKENPQSTHFWKKNSFAFVREISQDDGTIILAEREI